MHLRRVNRMEWYNNEDAGDLRMMSDADYSAEMASERAYARRESYREAFDAVTRSGLFPLRPVVHFPGTSYERTSMQPDVYAGRIVHGPAERPRCDECGESLERTDAGARFTTWGTFLCSDECEDHYF